MFSLLILFAAIDPAQPNALELFAFRAVAAISGSEITQSGTAAGVEYSVTSVGLQSTEFESSQDSFEFHLRSYFAKPAFRLSVNNGFLIINGKQQGAIKAGDRLTVSPDREVKVNGRVVR